MANSTLLLLIQRAARRLPLSTVPSEVVGSTSPMARQFLEIAQEEGDALRTCHEWSRLDIEWTITLSDDPHTEPYPEAFDRFKDKSRFWRSAVTTTPLAGPLGPAEWTLQTNLSSTFPGFWRRFQNGVQILGVPTTETVSTSYVTKNWIINDGLQPTISEWGADSDTCVFADRLMVLGIRWRWKQSKGLEYGQDFEDYELMRFQMISQDTSIETISTSAPDGYPGKPAWPGTLIAPA